MVFGLEIELANLAFPSALRMLFSRKDDAMTGAAYRI